MGNPVGHYFRGSVYMNGADVTAKLPRGGVVCFFDVPYGALPDGQRVAYRVDGTLTSQEFYGHVVQIRRARDFREATA